MKSASSRRHWPTSPDPRDDIPATVRYLGGRRVAIEHPLGVQHENAILTYTRMQAKGFMVVDLPSS